MKDILKNAIIGAVKTVIPTEQVKDAREVKNYNMKNLSFSEQVNYKLHDKTTWVSIALIGFYAFSQNWGGVVTEVLPLFGFDVVQAVQEVAK